VCLASGFRNAPGFHDLVRRGALKGATSATVTAHRRGSSSHHGDSVWIAAKPGAATLRRVGSAATVPAVVSPVSPVVSPVFAAV
jgi:hypothetical protein